MLKKRIIPCLDIQNGRTVKGINFVGIRDAGDPVELAKRYVIEGADELVFLDITATVEKRETLIELVERIASEIDIPFTVGGGISTVEDVSRIISAGADKVSINSAAVRRPELITEIAEQFGSQCVVLAIDVKRKDKSWKVAVKGGREITELDAITWAETASKLGAGEILLTSMEKDGTKSGFDLEVTNAVCSVVNVPVIASGGAGQIEDFSDLFNNSKASAGLAASIFHFGEIPIPDLKEKLKKQNIAVR
jgi:cyclase